jgi:transposase
MSKKELKRVKLFEFVKQGNMTLKEVSIQLEISYRQTLRLYAVYKEKGDVGLIHGNCGKKSNNCLSKEFRRKVLEIYRLRYSGFGPTFAAEKLSEENGIDINVSSLRNILIESGEWKKRHNAKVYRSRRERREYFGELLQFDGSHHKWFGEDFPSCCLMTMIDDATNIRMSRFFESRKRYRLL